MRKFIISFVFIGVIFLIGLHGEGWKAPPGHDWPKGIVYAILADACISGIIAGTSIRRR